MIIKRKRRPNLFRANCLAIANDMTYFHVNNVLFRVHDPLCFTSKQLKTTGLKQMDKFAQCHEYDTCIKNFMSLNRCERKSLNSDQNYIISLLARLLASLRGHNGVVCNFALHPDSGFKTRQIP